ncbi:HxlR family transcriptional regulator [Flavobacterium sp. 1]|uniref:winged helix-turn-helix transcriptional regulator n=1 Tax=Flavobacterium sp. 1 TaxID=2035200 RepID=UPI000C24865C|nr:helix-turn-helix domain-containing protein [Flavobacterium sp. 1]PJJ07259.1 HxlR family transcriptional regulator [Flavobacterium sp. 1]
METSKKRSECPLSCSLDVFGDKWSLLIIRDLIFYKKSTYNDFLKSAEGIATNILASRLKTLEENGIIEKSAHPDSKAKILYRLTEKGIDLLPIIMEVYIWSDKYYEMPVALKATIKEAKKDKDKFVKQVTKELKIKITEKKQHLIE